MTHLSVVLPVYNESSLIEELVKQVKENVKLITEDFEIILVDDGSVDQTWDLIEFEAKQEKRIKGIKFSRNFGHHYAITAGLQNSKGDWVVVMDGDLQDRPEVIPHLYSKAQSGFDVVFVSRQNRPEKLYYRIAQKIFYWILRTLSGIDFDSRQANFSIISKKVVIAFRGFPENARFYGSTIKWLGFKSSFIEADHGRRFAGRPSYTVRKRVKLASDIIFSFSDEPLRAAVKIGLLMSFVSIFVAIFVLYQAKKGNYTITGWASLIFTILFTTGLLMIINGIMGIYIGKIFQQVKERPLYVVDKQIL
jgi:glycosyltransferase involved in cell wall biosynthesis